MKKILTCILSALLLCTILLFSACSNTGVYKFVNLTYENRSTGKEHTLFVGNNYEGMLLTEDFATLILEKNNVAILRILEYDYDEYGNALVGSEEAFVRIGTWMKGYKNEIYIEFEGSSVIVAKRYDKRIVGEYMGVIVTLSK